jgi:hypothetical protein
MSTETSLQAGTGSQTGGLSRWGDYRTMTIEPVDDCTFWYTSEYLQTNGSFKWSTRVGSFKFSSCTGSDPEPPAPNFSLAATPSSRTITQGQSTTFDAMVTALNGYTGRGAFSVSGSRECRLVLLGASYSGGSGSSTLTITTSTSTSTGSLRATITATDTSGTLMQSTIVTLNVNPVPSGGRDNQRVAGEPQYQTQQDRHLRGHGDTVRRIQRNRGLQRDRLSVKQVVHVLAGVGGRGWHVNVDRVARLIGVPPLLHAGDRGHERVQDAECDCLAESAVGKRERHPEGAPRAKTGRRPDLAPT